MPSGLSFVDTNVIVYRVSQQDGRKRGIAGKLFETHQLALSTQVLQEFYATAVQPKKLGLSHDQAVTIIKALLDYPIHVMDVDGIELALQNKERFQLSYWDAAILASAQTLGRGILHSEDFNDGQLYGGVRVVNPFSPNYESLKRLAN